MRTFSLLFLLMAAVPATAQATKADIDRLIRQLGDSDFNQREQASKELAKIGKPALEALRQAATKHADAEVRTRARKAVDEIELADPVLGKARRERDLVPILVRKLDSPTFQEREAAMSELSKMDKEMLPLLQAVEQATLSLEARRRLQLIIENIKKR